MDHTLYLASIELVYVSADSNVLTTVLCTKLNALIPYNPTKTEIVFRREAKFHFEIILFARLH